MKLIEEILQSKISLINHAGFHYRRLDWKNKLCAVQNMIQPSRSSPVDLEQQHRSWVVKNLLGLGREEIKVDSDFFWIIGEPNPLCAAHFHWCLTLKVHVRASIGEAPLCSPAVRSTSDSTWHVTPLSSSSSSGDRCVQEQQSQCCGWYNVRKFQDSAKPANWFTRTDSIFILMASCWFWVQLRMFIYQNVDFK